MTIKVSMVDRKSFHSTKKRPIEDDVVAKIKLLWYNIDGYHTVGG